MRTKQNAFTILLRMIFSSSVEIRAVIFDMDGVISDTQSVMSEVESKLLKEHGVHLSPDEITQRYAGTKSKDMLQDAFALFKKPIQNIEALVEERRVRINTTVQGNIRAVPGTIDFIEMLKAHNMPIAVASASRIPFIRLVLTELNLLEKFDVITSSEEVALGKPEPDVFLLAAERLKVDPVFCVVIEDGVHGMVAARRAGMRCIGLVREGVHDNTRYPADILVRNLKDVRLESL